MHNIFERSTQFNEIHLIDNQHKYKSFRHTQK